MNQPMKTTIQEELFPPHKCGLYLEHNVYRDYYDSIDKAVADEDETGDWTSPEERSLALSSGDIWTLQWYPDTPVGFNRVAASSLKAVLDAAKEVAS